MRQRLELRQRTVLKTSVRQRLMISGSVFVLSALVAAGIFLWGNFGNNEEARASVSNMGFENGITDWTSIQGTWSINSTASHVRSGSKSLKIAQSNGLDGEIKNTNYQVTVPSSGTQHIIITAYGKGSDNYGQLRLGVIDKSNDLVEDIHNKKALRCCKAFKLVIS